MEQLTISFCGIGINLELMLIEKHVVFEPLWQDNEVFSIIGAFRTRSTSKMELFAKIGNDLNHFC